MPPILIAAIVVFLEVLALGAIIPVMADFSKEFGGSPIHDGVLFALIAAPKIVMNPIWGAFADRFGRKPILIFITLGTASGSLLWGLSGSLMMLMLSRLVAGVFSAQATIAQTIVSDVCKPEKRAGAMGMLGAAFGLAFTIGPAAGGYLAKTYDPASVGWLCMIFQLSAVVLVTLFYKETKTETAAQANQSHSLSQRFINWLPFSQKPQVIILAMTTLLMTAAYAPIIALIRRFTDEIYKLDVTQTGILMAAFGFISILAHGGLVRPLSKKLGDHKMTLIGMVTLFLGMCWIAGTLHLSDNFWSLCGALTLISIGTSLCGPGLMSLMANAADAEKQGVTQGVNQSATAIGRAIAYLSSGVLVVYASYSVALGVGAVCGLLALFLLFMHKTTKCKI